jgi:hypothetical protein
MSVDLVESDPTEPLIARPGQEITIAAPASWSIVHWEGYDAPVAGEGGNVWTPIDLVGGQRTITVPGLGREGDSLLTLELTMRRDDGRVVGMIPYSFLVRVSP